MKSNKTYEYEVGDVLTNVKHGKIKILEQTRIIVGKRKSKIKAYKYQCLICGNIDIVSENHMKTRYQGCSVCANRKILRGYNDIDTLRPDIANLFLNRDDRYRYSISSNKRSDFKCLNCGTIIKNRVISSVVIDGLHCPNCADGISYPEKIIFNVFQQLLQDKFIYQLNNFHFSWIRQYKYDFYFELNNESYIIETNGLQHYEYCFKGINGTRTLEEEQENDRFKKELAINNGIKEENYIVIDCRESDLEFIKNNVLHSRLNEIFDLSKIDWLQCEEFALSSRVKEACNLWNSGIHNTKDIGNKMKLCRNTVLKYLKHGEKLKWTTYNLKEQREKGRFKKK